MIDLIVYKTSDQPGYQLILKINQANVNVNIDLRYLSFIFIFFTRNRVNFLQHFERI